MLGVCVCYCWVDGLVCMLCDSCGVLVGFFDFFFINVEDC